MVDLLLVRHAHAGSKDRWHGDDRLRPLSRRGRDQARTLVEVLASRHPGRIVSSPYLRCLETVAPLAAHLGVAVEEEEDLRPDADGEAARFLRRLSKQDDTVVVCTHGETIEALQHDLGASRATAFVPGGPHEKGSVWELVAIDGEFAAAHYRPPGARGGDLGGLDRSDGPAAASDSPVRPGRRSRHR